MHCVDKHGVHNPSMTEIQVSNSTVLCKLLVRGWTVKAENFDITTYRLTSSDSVVIECKDRAETPNAYTVTISENKTYVSQAQKPTVTVPFVCLPKKYTDNRTELSKGVIKMQSPSVGGGGSSTSGSVTLDAADLNSAVLAFKRQVELLSTVINESIQTTTSAVSSAAAASEVAVKAARESAQNSSSTDNAVVQALNAVKEKLAALKVPQATIQNADNVSGLVRSLDGHISRLFAAMNQHNRRLLAEFNAKNNKLVQTIPAASSHGPSTVPPAPPAGNPPGAVAEASARSIRPSTVPPAPPAGGPSRQSTYSGSPGSVSKTILSDGTEPIPNLESLAKQLRKVIAQSNTTTTNSFSPKKVSQTHILAHEYIIHDPFYRRKTLKCSHVFTPSKTEWLKPKTTTKVCVMVSTYMAQNEAKHRRLLHNLSTLSMLIVQIFPNTRIQNYPRVYVCKYDPDQQYKDVKNIVPQNDVNNPSNGFDFDFAIHIFDTRRQKDVFRDCLLDTVPYFKTLLRQNGERPESRLIQNLSQNDNIEFVKQTLRLPNGSNPYYEYMLGLKYEIQMFEEIRQAKIYNPLSKLQNVQYFEHSLPNDLRRAYLHKAIKETIDKLQAQFKPKPEVELEAVTEANAHSIDFSPVATAAPASNPPAAVPQAGDLLEPVGRKQVASPERGWQFNFNLYSKSVAQPFKPMLKRCSEYEQFVIIEHLSTFNEIVEGMNSKEITEMSKTVLKPSFEYALWFGATVINDSSVDALWDVYRNYELETVQVSTIAQKYTAFHTKIIKEYNADEQRSAIADWFRKQYETRKNQNAAANMQSAMRKIQQNVENEKAALASIIAQDDHFGHSMQDSARNALDVLQSMYDSTSIDNNRLMDACHVLLEEFKRNQILETRQFIVRHYKHALLHYKYDLF